VVSFFAVAPGTAQRDDLEMQVPLRLGRSKSIPRQCSGTDGYAVRRQNGRIRLTAW
jgi:hypothetical protein